MLVVAACLLVVVTNKPTFADDCNTPIVHTPLGTIVGAHKKSFGLRTYSAFEGIPFAKAPIGKRRFEAPIPIEKWNVTLDASFLYECSQVRPLTLKKIISGDEDCLYINVYTPRRHPSPLDNLDVIVHIHGGGFMFGSGHAYARPGYLMDRNVIFVSFNYRLGILGFLSTEDEVLPGNNGLKDQVLALRWVQENIASFGGNPKSVTLTGASSGAASVHLHYLSRISRGLFHRGLSQSGSALNPWVLKRGIGEKAKILRVALGCPQPSRELVKCLKEKQHEEILEKIHSFYGYKFYPVSIFGPVVEKGLFSHTFLTEEPYLLLAKGQVLDVPWVVSFVPHEAGTSIPDFRSNPDVLYSVWNKVASILLFYDRTLPESKWDEVAEKIRNFYFDPSHNYSDNFVKMGSDRSFIGPIIRSATLQAKKSPVYLYELSYSGDYKKTVEHSDDNQYFFNDQYHRQPTENELEVKDLMVNMLVGYAQTGRPIVEGIDWRPLREVIEYVNILGYKPEEIKLETNQNLGNLDFWDSLGFQENTNLD